MAADSSSLDVPRRGLGIASEILSRAASDQNGIEAEHPVSTQCLVVWRRKLVTVVQLHAMDPVNGYCSDYSVAVHVR
jgi:hypothetical protein